MDKSPIVSDVAYHSRERRWKQVQANKLDASVAVLRQAATAALKRIVATGLPREYTPSYPIINRYEHARTFFGRQYIVPVFDEDVPMWTLGTLDNLHIGLDNKFYEFRRSTEVGKDTYHIYGAHVLSDEELRMQVAFYSKHYTDAGIAESIATIAVDTKPAKSTAAGESTDDRM